MKPRERRLKSRETSDSAVAPVTCFSSANADAMAIKKQFEGEAFDFFSVYPARNTVQDLKGPYCETSPLLPFVRRARCRVPHKVGHRQRITDFLCGKGITLTHMDEYRSGKDVVLECILHLPTGLAEFPAIDDKTVLKKLESFGALGFELAAARGDLVKKRRRGRDRSQTSTTLYTILFLTIRTRESRL